MKKTLLITLDWPPNIGGVANYYTNLCRNLPPEKIIVLAPAGSTADNFDGRQNYKIIRKNLLSANPLVWPKWRPLIQIAKKIIKQEKIETILVGQILPVGTVAWYLAKTKKIPYYVFCHGMDIAMPRGRKKILIKKILKEATGIIANSNFTKSLIVSLGGAEEKIRVIYPCPNLKPPVDFFAVQTLKDKRRLHHKKVLLTIGRLVQRKGHEFVIRALPEILKYFPNTIYVIAGSGPEEEILQLLARNQRVADRVIFGGRLDDYRLKAWLEICDIFIMTPQTLPSGDVEGFGTVYLEAGLFGKPVIGNRSGGVPEAIIDGQTGLLVDSENPKDIAQAVIKILKDESLAHRLGLQGMHRAQTQFQWPEQAQKIANLL